MSRGIPDPHFDPLLPAEPPETIGNVRKSDGLNGIGRSVHLEKPPVIMELDIALKMSCSKHVRVYSHKLAKLAAAKDR